MTDSPQKPTRRVSKVTRVRSGRFDGEDARRINPVDARFKPGIPPEETRELARVLDYIKTGRVPESGS
ncbi:MAG TPA: hypothetical protein VEW42_06500 [Candidatus Eisenbacteria bacterium]|nr:hypothetical protein [Candidatus Eisenbacteria bacterium]